MNSADVDALFDEANGDLALGELDAAVDKYRRCVDLDPQFNSIPLDLNFDPCPPEHVGKYGFVTNHGGDVDGRDPGIQDLITGIYGPEAEARSAVRYAEPFAYSGTTNTGGFEAGGERQLTMWVVEIPPDVVGPRPDDDCGSVTGR